MKTVILILSSVALLGMLVPAVWGEEREPSRAPAEPRPAVPAAAIPSPPPYGASSAGAAIVLYRLELLDKDRDGYVSREEAAAVPELLEAFDRLDTNRDGRLDRNELAGPAR